MAADSWSKHKVMRTGRGQEGGSGMGQTEDAPDQQGFRPQARAQHQTHGQGALSSILLWDPNIYLSWKRCILAQNLSLSCCPAVPLLITTCQTSGSSLAHDKKLPHAVLPQQPHHRARAAAPHDSSPRLCLHKQVSRGLVLTDNFTQFGLLFSFSWQFLSSCKNTVQFVRVSTTLDLYQASRTTPRVSSNLLATAPLCLCKKMTSVKQSNFCWSPEQTRRQFTLPVHSCYLQEKKNLKKEKGKNTAQWGKMQFSHMVVPIKSTILDVNLVWGWDFFPL